MDTLSVTMRARPLRVGWCIDVGDVDGFRWAVRASFTMWGGRYNPVIPVNHPELAAALVKLYRVDALKAVSDTEATRAFIESHKHLPWPLFHDELFIREDKHAALVDISHPVARLYDEHFKGNQDIEPGLEVYQWDATDPLSDVFLTTFGGVLPAEECGKDYAALASTYLRGQPHIIAKDAPVPPINLFKMNIATVGDAFMARHYSVQNYWNNHGFYVGEAGNLDDLVNFWNLRAASIDVQFYDPEFAGRFELHRNAWIDVVTKALAKVDDDFREPGPALWHRRNAPVDNPNDLKATLICAVDEPLWNGMNLRAPVMYFAERPALASIGESYSRKNISFAVTGLPFAKNSREDQHFVLSVDTGIGLFGNERATLNLPFLPALNEYYGRNCTYEWNAARAEPGSLGVVISTRTNAVTLRAIDVTELVTEIFKTVGIDASPSAPGRIATTLIQQMGGLQGCRPFKIAGVRRLIEDYRPDQNFSRSTAKQTINGQGDTRPLAEYQWLYIEPRRPGENLTTDAVLSYLLERGVFRAGLSFKCPSCELDFWRSLDDARSQLECEYCGRHFNAAPQLRDKDWAFRRSGLFGRDDHQGGAIPVVLTLQQFRRSSGMRKDHYACAMELKPAGADIRRCETDLVVISQSPRDHRIEVVIGECKTRQPITADDVRNLRAIADAFPRDAFDVYVVFSRLTPFSQAEIEAIAPLNDERRLRAIMFTERELEPYQVYDRTSQDFEIDRYAVGFGDMARATRTVFFQQQRREPAAG